MDEKLKAATCRRRFPAWPVTPVLAASKKAGLNSSSNRRMRAITRRRYR